MKTFTVAEWEDDKTGDNIFKQFKVSYLERNVEAGTSRMPLMFVYNRKCTQFLAETKCKTLLMIIETLFFIILV